MAHQHYQSPFGDTTLTKVFVGGLAWETPTDVLRAYFDQFGDILEAVIIKDKHTGKSKGYGFVTFRDPESAQRACADPNPVIGGRRANCSIASLGRPRPSPPRAGNLYQGSASPAQDALPLYRPPPPPLPPVIYPPYGYTAFPPNFGYQQTMYNSPHAHQQTPPPFYSQVYGAPTSPNVGAPYYYGYSSVQGPGPTRGTFPIVPPAQRIQAPPYLYYPAQAEASSSSSFYPPPPHFHLGPPSGLPFPRGGAGVAPPQTPRPSSTGTEAAAATSSA